MNIDDGVASMLYHDSYDSFPEVTYTGEENYYDVSPFKSRLMTYERLKVKDTTGMSFLEYIDLTRPEMEDVNDVCKYVIKRNSSDMTAVTNGLDAILKPK